MSIAKGLAPAPEAWKRPKPYDLDVEIATKYPKGDLHREMAEERLMAAGVEDISDWQIIGTRFDDHSGYDEFDGKWECYSETRLLMVRKVDMNAARERYFAAQNERLTHNPFAAVLGC